MVPSLDSLLMRCEPIPMCGCFIWMDAIGRGGYGKVRIESRDYTTHRVAYALSQGLEIQSLPRSLVIRHVCDTRACCNPDHLAPGTTKDNVHDAIRRGRHARAFSDGRCVRGHVLAEVGLRIQKGTGRPHRKCAECARIRGREQMRRMFGYAPCMTPEARRQRSLRIWEIRRAKKHAQVDPKALGETLD